LSLVLDSVNSALGSPVNGVGEVGSIKHNNVLAFLSDSTSEELLVLFMSPGGHVVVADGEGLLAGVDSVNLSVLNGELLVSEAVLLLGSVRDTVLSQVSVEGVVRLVHHVVLLALVVLDTSEGSGFAEELHLFFV